MTLPDTPEAMRAHIEREGVAASPFTRRSITRIIQPVPSRHGVHWPQLSCL